MPSLEEIANMPDEDLDEGFDVDKDAAIQLYEDIVKRYGNKEEFRVGDIVTPREGYGLKKAGFPHVVVEVLDIPLSAGHPNPGDVRYTPRLDIRCIRAARNNVLTFWFESWQLERWKR